VLAIAGYMGGGGDAISSLNSIFSAINTQLGENQNEFFPQNKAYADQMGMKLVAYEGGQHCDGYSTGSSSPNIRAAQLDPRMGTAYTQLMQIWREAGGGLFCHYNLTGPPGSKEAFGLLEHSRQTSSIKWNALFGN